MKETKSSNKNKNINKLNDSLLEIKSNISIKDTPIKDNPIKDTPIKDNPIKHTPIKDSPIKHTPIKANPINRSKIANDIPIKNTSIKEYFNKRCSHK